MFNTQVQLEVILGWQGGIRIPGGPWGAGNLLFLDLGVDTQVPFYFYFKVYTAFYIYFCL